MYSRIDYYFVPHSQLEAVQNVGIGNITWSDHAPITMHYCLSSSLITRSKFWRLNESLLQTLEVLTDVQTELTHYFRINDTGDCTPGIVWEAHKTVIRGILIKHGACIKKEKERLLLDSLPKIHDAESKHKKKNDLLNKIRGDIPQETNCGFTAI